MMSFFKKYAVLLSRYIDDEAVVVATVDECLWQERESRGRWNGDLKNSVNNCSALFRGFIGGGRRRVIDFRKASCVWLQTSVTRK